MFRCRVSAVNFESSSRVLLRSLVPSSQASLGDASALEELTNRFVLVALQQQMFYPFYVRLEV